MCKEEASFVGMIFFKIWAAMLFEPEQTWLHEVISECEKQQTSDIQSVLYTISFPEYACSRVMLWHVMPSEL
jgi:hypothetical protein